MKMNALAQIYGDPMLREALEKEIESLRNKLETGDKEAFEYNQGALQTLRSLVARSKSTFISLNSLGGTVEL